MKKRLFTVIICLWAMSRTMGQTCTSNPTTLSSNTNFASVSWTGAGGVSAATCAAIANGTNTSTTANFFVDLSNGTILTISNNITIHGNFDITGGPGSTLKVSGGGAPTTLHVTGDLGDAANNGVDYTVMAATDHMVVDGTLYGKNNNAFTGNGSISGGSINVKNGTTCGSPCPVSGGFTSCTAGDSFCSTYSLPVKLISFSSQLNGGSVLLNWSTASELNFDYFNLERSGDGSLFQSIGQKKGHGTTNEKHDYEFADDFPLIGKNYYRLISVDFDNYQEKFDVIVQEYSGQKDFQISPNPTDGSEVNLIFNFDESNGQLVVFDNLGSVIGAYSIDASGAVSFASPLKNGIYLAKYTSPSFSKTLRFLVK